MAAWATGALLAIAGLVLAIGVSKPEGALSRVVPTLVSLFLLFIVLPGLICKVGSLVRLRSIQRILTVYAWEQRPSVHRLPHIKEFTGVPVTIQNTAGDDEWEAVVIARHPLSRGRWDARMEKGAWFAGDVPLGGVVALPGGEEQMRISHRLGRERQHERARGDARRIRRAIAAGLW